MESLKVLFIGNSFAVDTTHYTPDGVDGYARRVAAESAANAIKHPLEVTQSAI